MTGAREPGHDRFLGWVTNLVHQHRSRLVQVAWREGLSGEDALDCAQDAFVTFLFLPQARLLAAEPDEAVKILVVLARNHARNQRRRHAIAKPHLEAPIDELASDQRSADEVVAEAEDYVMMVGCAATLSQIQRVVVELRLLDDVPGEEAAKLLGITPSHVAVLLHRAKRKLRQCFLSAQ